MLHLSYPLEKRDCSETTRCENKRFSTALRIQIVLALFLVAFTAALFCLPAKNAYAAETTIDGVAYTYTSESGYITIEEISSDYATSVTVPEKIDGSYVYGLHKGYNYSAHEYDSISISDNITSLDVSNCSELERLVCSGNRKLSYLKVSGLKNLVSLECSYTNLTSLDASGLVNLRKLNCERSNLSSLNLSGLTSLHELDCTDNRLISLDLSGLCL